MKPCTSFLSRKLLSYYQIRYLRKMLIAVSKIMREKDKLIVHQGQTKTETICRRYRIGRGSKLPQGQTKTGIKKSLCAHEIDYVSPKSDYKNLKDQIVKRQ